VPNANDQSELTLYQTDDGITRIHVRLVDGSVWLTQRQLADLYQVSVPTVSEHLHNIFAEGELSPELFGNSERFELKGIARFLGRSTTTRCRSCSPSVIACGRRVAPSSGDGPPHDSRSTSSRGSRWMTSD
jgi:hypothetical protein